MHCLGFDHRITRWQIVRSFIIFVCVTALTITGHLSTFAQRKTATNKCTAQECDSGFRPEIHGWENRNIAYSSFARSTGFEAINGTCYGMARLAQVAFDPTNKNRPGLFESTSKMDPLFRHLYAATSHAMLWGQASSVLQKAEPPRNDTFGSIRNQIMATGKPQVLLLTSSKPNVVGHAVLVTGFRRDGDRTFFSLYDPNRPALARKSVIVPQLEYSEVDGQFTIRSSDADGPIYAGREQVRHDRDELQPSVLKAARDIILDARDGKIDSRMGLFDLVRSAATNRSSSIKLVKEKLGGVKVYYDPALLDGEFEDEAVGRLLEDLLAELEAGRSNLALRINGGKEEAFETLSMRSWLASGSRTLGELTRVRGFVVKQDDILIVGQIEPGRPKIDSDLLLVALKTIYREGRSPGVSLDMDRKDPYGLQSARVVDLPKDLIHTEFVRVMFEADYMMKRILFNEENLSVPEYKSYYDLVQKTPESGFGSQRFWLAPMQGGPGEVLENGTAFLFESEVRVMTQKEKLSEDDFPVFDPAVTSPLGDESARNLTRYYSSIEKEKEIFYSLHQLFDVSKLSAILRHKRIRSQVLDEALERIPRTVNRKDEQGNKIDMLAPYRGIGPKLVEGTTVAIGGGVDLGLRFDADSFARSAKLDGLSNGKAVVALDRTLPLAEKAYLVLLVRDAASDCLASRFEQCIEKSSRALADDLSPILATQMRIMRATGQFELGQTKDSLSDIDFVLREHPDEPIPLVLRAGFRLYSGDLSGAKADASRAVELLPNETTLAIKAEVDLCNLDFKAAREDLRRLALIDPTESKLIKFKTMLRFLEPLSGEMARRWVKSELGRPIPISRIYIKARGLVGNGKPKEAVFEFERILKMTAGKPSPRGGNDYIREEALFWIAIGKAMGGGIEAEATPAIGPRSWDASLSWPEVQKQVAKPPDYGIADARKLIAMHPTWGSGYLLEVFCRLMSQEKILNQPQINLLLRQAFSTDLTTDPLALNLIAVFGGEKGLRRYFYVMAYLKALELRTDGGAFLAQLATENSLEGKLAKHLMMMDSTKDQSSVNATLTKVRPFAKEALIARPADDFGSNVLWFTFINSYKSFEQIAGNSDTYKEATGILFSLEPASSNPSVVDIVSFMKAKLIDRRASSFERGFEADPELKLLMEKARTAQPQLDGIERRVGELESKVVEEPWANVTQFNRSLSQICLIGSRLRLQLKVLDQNVGYPGRTQDEYDRMEELKAELVVRYRMQLIEAGNKFLTLPDESWTITDLKTAEKLFSWILNDSRLDNETSKRLKSMYQTFRSKVMVREMVEEY